MGKKDWQGLDYRHCDIPLPMTYPWDRNIYQAISPCSCGHFSYHALGDNPYMEHLRYLSIGFIFGNLCQADFSNTKTNTASILLKKIFGLISTSHLSITNLNLCTEILPFYVHPNHLPQNAPGCLTSHAPWLPYPKTWRPFAAFAAVFCPDLETSPDLHSCDRNWKFWLPKSKKKTSQILVSKFPSNHHNLDGLDFSRYKKKYMTLLWLSIAPIKK